MIQKVRQTFFLKKFCTATIFFKDFSELDNLKNIVIHCLFCPSFVILTSYCFLIICQMLFFEIRNILYSWIFLPNSARSHWLLRGHMTSNIETVTFSKLCSLAFQSILKTSIPLFQQIYVSLYVEIKQQQTTQKREFLCIVRQ